MQCGSSEEYMIGATTYLTYHNDGSFLSSFRALKVVPSLESLNIKILLQNNLMISLSGNQIFLPSDVYNVLYINQSLQFNHVSNAGRHFQTTTMAYTLALLMSSIVLLLYL